MSRNLNTVRGVAALALCVLAPVLAAQTAVPAPQTNYVYDANGNVVQVSDALGHGSTFAYDALQRRTSTTDAKNGVTAYNYDLRDQLIDVTDARSVVTTYTIDGLGNLSQLSSGDTGTAIHKYDAGGNLIERTDAKSQRTTYQYDALNRLTRAVYADNTDVVYQYDVGANAAGKISSITDASGSIQYAYDSFGRLATETRTIGGTAYATSYRYDAAGRLSGMRYPGGRDIDYIRDDLGQISQITMTTGGVTAPVLSHVTYQPFGPVSEVTFANGRTQVRSYDKNGRLATFSLSTQTMAISYDAASRITGIADAANAASGNTYGYDALDRLNSVITPTAAQGYTYDAVGNRTEKTNNGSTTSYSYSGAGNRLTQVGAQAIAMDANGSITGKPNATFNYDARGRMVSSTTALGVVTYTINSLGQRVRKVTPTETTVFHYDAGGLLIAESTTSGGVTTTQEYVYLGQAPVAVLK